MSCSRRAVHTVQTSILHGHRITLLQLRVLNSVVKVKVKVEVMDVT